MRRLPSIFHSGKTALRPPVLSIWDHASRGRGRCARCHYPVRSPGLLLACWGACVRRGRSLRRGSEDPCVQTDTRSSVSIHRTPLAVPLPDPGSPRIALRFAPRRRPNRPRLRRRSAARTRTQRQQTDRTCTITYTTTTTHRDLPTPARGLGLRSSNIGSVVVSYSFRVAHTAYAFGHYHTHPRPCPQTAAFVRHIAVAANTSAHATHLHRARVENAPTSHALFSTTVAKAPDERLRRAQRSTKIFRYASATGQSSCPAVIRRHCI